MALVNKAFVMALIQPMTGLQATSVVWDKSNQPFISDVDRAKVTLSLKSYAGNGVDDIRRELIDPSIPTTYYTTHVGQRNLVLTLKCEVYDHEAEASEILENVRMQLRQTEIVNLMTDNFLSLQAIEGTVDLPTTYDDHVVNVASMDIHLGAVNQRPRGQVDGYIETVNTNDQVPFASPFGGAAHGHATVTGHI